MSDVKPPKGVTVGMPIEEIPSGPMRPTDLMIPSAFELETRRWAELRMKLRAYFAPQELEWRIQSSSFNGDYPWAMALAYINNRAVETRLDNACGIGNWQNDFRELHSGGYQCGIGIRVVGTDWVWKWDASDKTQVEPVKGGHSGAMKRAAQQWEIGRYLYYFPTCFVQIRLAGNERCPEGWHSAYVKRNRNDKDGVKCYWETPMVPDWAMPEIKADEKDLVY